MSQNRIPKYRMYVDEVGNSSLKTKINPNERFLSLTGIIIELESAKNILVPEVEKLKINYFNSHPDDPIILHRKELLKGSPPFDILQTPTIREKFDKDLISLIQKVEFTIVSSVIDKLEHINRYQEWRYDPYHYSLSLLIENFCSFLEESNSVGDVMTESRGGSEDLKLKTAFKTLIVNGTEYVSSTRLMKNLTSKELKIKSKSNNVAGLQLCDLLACPSRNIILADKNLRIADQKDKFVARICEIIEEKYYNKLGKVEGYGKRFLP